mmetsp:Transcript_1341/g.4993  ORF Transcript_1341/g.4993 Transcript_1341/m.4993 type:complete len:264 (-) Transcript_1341:252-1043(-)
MAGGDPVLKFAASPGSTKQWEIGRRCKGRRRLRRCYPGIGPLQLAILADAGVAVSYETAYKLHAVHLARLPEEHAFVLLCGQQQRRRHELPGSSEGRAGQTIESARRNRASAREANLLHGSCPTDALTNELRQLDQQCQDRPCQRLDSRNPPSQRGRCRRTATAKRDDSTCGDIRRILTARGGAATAGSFWDARAAPHLQNSRRCRRCRSSRRARRGRCRKGNRTRTSARPAWRQQVAHSRSRSRGRRSRRRAHMCQLGASQR